MNNKLLSLVKVVFAILAFTLLAYKFIPTISSNEFRLFVERIGFFGPFILVGYIILSHVIAPVVGAPALFVAFSVYGVYKGALLVYLASLISATINFWIARKLGREWVTKLVGKKEMDKVDDFVDSSGTTALILGRTLGFMIFEIVSYAAGLTEMSFKKYIKITAIYSLIPSLIITLTLTQTDLSNVNNLLPAFGVVVVIGWALIYLMFKLLNKKD